ncbi:unnamed protein product [Adineta ricciae]|uniref:Glycine cleavage system H protein, mitochondrial n=1 Tax=Adineta ricciae TaxID=249248 RepID=A0A815QX81_ADIRI|nr:unnamed protein product [Adineta ricciae]
MSTLSRALLRHATKLSSIRQFHITPRVFQERYYTKKHEWVQILDNKKEVRIGISDFAQNALGDVVYCELPAIGAKFKREETFATLESVKAVADCFMPVDGEISSVNEQLKTQADLINKSPYDNGWLVQAKMNKTTQEHLLDEGDSGGVGESSQQVTTMKYAEKPPPPRNETNLSGLKNQGATCYLNVLIQTLLYTPEFREPLFRLTPGDLNLPANYNDQNASTTNGNNNPKIRKIIVELQRLFAEMLLLNQQSCSSIPLTNSFGWQSNEAIDHQDVHELNRLLFDAIHKSLQGTKQANLIRLCYEGSTINYTQCKQCQNTFKRSEDYQDLPLVVQDSPGLQTSLANIFTISEQLIGDNQYRCSTCANNLCDAEKWAKISKLPPILTLPLQRFVYDIKTGNREKKTTRYEFPFEIDLQEYCEESVAKTNYELFAVVIHRGTCYSGHYYGYIKDIDQIGTWIRPPPKSPSMKASQKAKSSNTANTSSNSNESHESSEETMRKLDLVKTLLLSCDDWITTEDLLKSYRENTTTSWSRTRGAHGTFNKFLRSHPEVFEVDNNRVRLVEQNYSMEVDNNDIYEMEYESSQNEALDENAEHWFCFDDSIVTCVTRENIKKHYEQNECAYMLFYRQKNRSKSKDDSATSTPFSIPQWLFDEVVEKNRLLEEARENYDKYQNQFSVTIYPSDWFEIVDDCRLNLNNKNQVLFPDGYGEHVFDKRMKVNEFLSKFESKYGDGSHFYVAKKLRSGQLHVISELTYSTNDKTLDRNDLSTYRNVIIYKYPSSLPDTVLQGEEFEPVMLNIVYGFPDARIRAPNLQSTRYVAKNTTLAELKERLTYDYYRNANPQQLRQIRMGKLNLEEKNNRKSRREYKSEDEKQTLAQLHLQDGDTLGIDDKNSFVSNWRDVSSNNTNLGKTQLSLTVKNSIDPNYTKPMTYSCESTTLIADVKLMAIEAFGVSLEPNMCRLFIDNHPDVAHIPLYDHDNVGEINFKDNNTQLCLKFGPALHENDLLLYILSDREPSSLELVVDQNMTLTDLWLLIKQELKMDLDDNEYHLREVVSSFEDDGTPLNDFHQTLTNNGLSNGAQLTMRPGSVPTKNHVRLKVFQIFDKIYKQPEAIHTVPLYEMVPFDNVFELPVISPFNVLRERIAQTIEFKVPPNYARDTKPSEFIRLYEMEDDQPVSIIHEPVLTTLKQAKVQDLGCFAFELLSHPESLGKKDLLLNIVYDKNEYGSGFQHQFEVHWPLKENIVAKYEYLEQHVLTRLTSFMTDHLHFKNVSKRAFKITLARYFPDRAQWLIIDPRSATSSSQSTSKKNKTSSTPTKSNLKLEPYKLDDLTVIGVLEGEQLTVEDFDTPYDQKMRRQLERETEQKRLTREKTRTENDQNKTNGSSGRRRSPQNTMRIDVDDFDA